MVSEDAATKVLEYIKKQGQTNTFRLASQLGIDRSRVLNIVKKLEEKEAVEVKSGIVFFLKFPRKEKKAVEKKPVKKAPSKPKKEVKHKKTVLETIQAENKRLKDRILELDQKARTLPKIVTRTRVKEVVKRVPVKSKKLKEQTERIKELEEKIKELQSAPPKIIRRTKVEKIIQKVLVKSEKFKEQTERIKELEEKIRELQSVPPKVIRRMIVKKVPEIIRKVIIKKIPVKIKEEKPKKKIKFKFPKINLSGLGKSIKRLHVPETLRNP